MCHSQATGRCFAPASGPTGISQWCSDAYRVSCLMCEEGFCGDRNHLKYTWTSNPERNPITPKSYQGEDAACPGPWRRPGTALRAFFFFEKFRVLGSARVGVSGLGFEGLSGPRALTWSSNRIISISPLPWAIDWWGSTQQAFLHQNILNL